MEILDYLKWFEHFDIGVYFVDRDRKIRFMNKSACDITGFTKRDIINTHCHDNIFNHVSEDGVELCQSGCPLLDTIRENAVKKTTVYLHHKAGHRLKVHVKTLPVVQGGRVIGAIETFSPSGTNNLLEANLHYYKKKAETDHLTALNNRETLDARVPEMIQGAEESVTFGVIFADIDNFKVFNDTYGHATGDKVLIAIAKTIQNALRDTDIAIRYGGEEFLVIAHDVDRQRLMTLAEKIRLLAMHSRLREGVETHCVTLSLGATLLDDGTQLHAAIKRADEAMYHSKKNGKNQVTFY